MSHFYIIAIVPQSVPVPSIEEFIGHNMERYDENKEVTEYEQPCSCVGIKARRECIDKADEELGSFRKLRESFVPLEKELLKKHGVQYAYDLKGEQSDELDVLWQVHIGPRIDREEELFKSHPENEAFDPECNCTNGIEKTTYNPDSKWDWYVIGGRWDGAVRRDRRFSQGGFNFGADHRRLENNCIPVAEVLKDWDPEQDTPYAVLGPDGKWYAKGEMGWFGMSDDKSSHADWNAEVLEILKAHEGDHLLVGLDCHI